MMLDLNQTADSPPPSDGFLLMPFFFEFSADTNVNYPIQGYVEPQGYERALEENQRIRFPSSYLGEY